MGRNSLPELALYRQRREQYRVQYCIFHSNPRMKSKTDEWMSRKNPVEQCSPTHNAEQIQNTAHSLPPYFPKPKTK
jgi:hypothetical protein